MPIREFPRTRPLKENKDWKDIFWDWFRDLRQIVNYNNRETLSTDPADPVKNSHVIWQSDGTGSGDDGDIMIKITDSGGTTATGTLVDYSGL